MTLYSRPVPRLLRWALSVCMRGKLPPQPKGYAVALIPVHEWDEYRANHPESWQDDSHA